MAERAGLSVSQAYTAACFVTTAAVHMNLVTPFQIYFNPNLIFRGLQIWRLVTNFLYFGELSFSFLFKMLFMYRYCSMLEETSFRGRTADFVFMFLFGGVIITAFALFVNLLFLGQAFTLMLVYIWCRRNPSIRLNILGLVSMSAAYLPWLILTLSLLAGESALVDALGIAVGHIYYFLEDVFPNQPRGMKLLVTPGILKHIFEDPDVDPNYNPLQDDTVNEGNDNEHPHED